MLCSCSVSRSSCASGPVELLGGESQRSVEADPGLDGDDEQVDQLGELPVDQVVSLARLAVEDHRREVPAEQALATTIPST